MSGMISKSQIALMHRRSLPGDVLVAVISFKNDLRAGVNITAFLNGKLDHRGRRHAGPSPLPRLDDGCCYYEYDVGAGRTDRGNRRLVAEVVTSSREIRELYFTDDHYTKGSFVRLV